MKKRAGFRFAAPYLAGFALAGLMHSMDSFIVTVMLDQNSEAYSALLGFASTALFVLNLAVFFLLIALWMRSVRDPAAEHTSFAPLDDAVFSGRAVGQIPACRIRLACGSRLPVSLLPAACHDRGDVPFGLPCRIPRQQEKSGGARDTRFM